MSDENDAKELSIRQELDEYRNQIAKINEQNIEDNDEINVLKANLQELCQLLEDELLKIEKNKLLKELEINHDDDQQQNKPIEDSKIETSESSARNQFECSVPYRFENGQIEYHDALVIVDDDSQLKAFFLYPVEKSMKTCQFFIQDNCHFGDNCKYSHGVSVTSIDQLQSKISINLSSDDDDFDPVKISQCKNCLVQSDDDESLWQKGRILSIDAEKEQFLVQIKNEEVSVNFEKIVLMQNSESNIEDNHEKLIESNSKDQSIDNHQIPDSIRNEFGEWEKYTKGIGSKLMMKMGYEQGRGLGRQSQGIVDPIEQIVYPPGRSLDHCIQLKQEHERKKQDWREILKEKNKKLKFEAKLADDYAKTDRVKRKKSIFEFLNKQLNDDSTTSARKTSSFAKHCSTASAIRSMDQKNLNIASLKCEQNLQRAQMELNKMQRKNEIFDQTNHNNSNNALIKKDITKSIEKQKNLIAKYRRENDVIKKEIKSRFERNKLINF